MSEGLDTTLQLLKTTANEAAVRVLVPALDSPSAVIREGALTAILSRRNPAAGHGEVLRRLHALDERSRAIVEAHRERMTQALRDAVLGGDLRLCANGCAAAVWFREYDLIPALVTLLEDPSGPKGKLAGKTLTELVSRLYGELAKPVRGDSRRDPEMSRGQVIGTLERSLQRFARHRRREILEAYLLLVRRDSAVLKQMLDDPHHAAFLALVDVLSSSQAAGVIGLLLAFLDDRQAPSSVLSVIANRCDLKFLQYLLRKIGRQPSTAVKHNLRRIESVPWLEDVGAVLDQLDDMAQHAAVRLAVTSAIPRSHAFAVVKCLLLQGKPGGRRAAAEALSEFHGAEANALVLQSLNDDDPQVQASGLVQLRQRGILGSLPRLVEKVDSHYPVVRQAARTSLDEFSFERFLAAFDMLDDEVRRTAGTLVKKVDPDTFPRLKAELGARARARRLRALAIARVIGAVGPLESKIIGLLHDDDHMVRAEAARALAQGKLVTSWAALEDALEDSSTAVQQAARESLHHRIPPVKENDRSPNAIGEPDEGESGE